tara:strand:- start:487 stop:1017 length:531 start_codon:yes stop_codon:yes gene_type:complete
MKFVYLLLIFLTLNACSKIRDSAGVTRKSIDEFQVVENPPLIIPPDFNLEPPDQLKAKNIDDIEKELAKEILFGIDEDEIIDQNEISTMNEILKKTNALEVDPSIREEIDEDFAKELDTKGVFQVKWENEVEILDAVKESERIRNKNFEGESLADGEVPTKKEVIKKKKKKRFILF